MDDRSFAPPPSDAEADLSRYESYIADLNFTADQSRELLGAVWSIMTAFADYGFDLDPAQLICGWIEESGSQPPIAAADEVESKGRPTTKTFNGAARGTPPTAGKESS